MDMYIFHRIRKFLSIILSLSLVIASIPPLCAQNFFIASPGYSELEYSIFRDEPGKFQTMPMKDKIGNKGKSQKFIQWISISAIAAIILGGVITLSVKPYKIKERLQKIEMIQYALQDILWPSKPSPGIPAGFFDVESKEMPAHFRVAAQKVYNSIARILVYEKKDDKEKLIAFGSGVVVSPDGHIMTANHIIEEYISSDKYYIVIEIPTIQNSVRMFKRYPDVKIIKDMCDKQLDIGVVKIDIESPLTYVKPEFMVTKPGDKIVILGHPRGTQRCYVSAGEILKASLLDKPFYFRHNADCRGGNSGSGVFLIDSEGNPHFTGIATRAGGLTYWMNKYIEPYDFQYLSIIQALEIPYKPSGQPPSEVKLQDVVNNFNPNIGKPISFGIATKLSTYFSKNKNSTLLSYPYDNSMLQPFDVPTFVLTRSLSSTYGNDDEVNRITQNLIAAAPRLAVTLNELGIYHIHITALNSVTQYTLSLDYDTKDPIHVVERMLSIEKTRRELSKYCQQYGFTVDVNEKHIKIDTIELILGEIKNHAPTISTALKGTEIQEIRITNRNSISGNTLNVDSKSPDIIQSVMNLVELEKLRIQINRNLASYRFDINKIYYGYDNIPKTKILLNKIHSDAKAISKLFKDKGVINIIISNHNGLYKPIVHIDCKSTNPIESIKDAFKKAQEEKSEQRSSNISKAGSTEEFIEKSN